MDPTSARDIDEGGVVVIPWTGRRRTPTPVNGPSGGHRPVASDPEAAAALFDEYYDRLLAFTVKLTGGDQHWAEDVVQETLLRAWRHADELDGNRESLMPWLATVARRVVIDQKRMRDVRPTEVREAAIGPVPVADDTEAMLRTVVVTDALRSLSPSHREVLVETLLRDRTVNQAAEVLGVPVGTVKSRVYYATRALRVVLQEMGVSAS